MKFSTREQIKRKFEKRTSSQTLYNKAELNVQNKSKSSLYNPPNFQVASFLDVFNTSVSTRKHRVSFKHGTVESVDPG